MTIPFNLGGAVTVVTGGGSGIGRAIALAFAERGASIVVSDLLADRAETVCAEIRATGTQAAAVAVDVTSEDAFEALRDLALDRFGRVDVVVNNAGVLAMGAPESLPDQAWQRVLDVNVMALARSNRAFLPTLIAQGSGHVVNTASASGLLAYGFDRLPYVASKHAVVGITEALALYLGPRGVGVTCLCPSGVMTNIVEQISVHGGVAATPRAPDYAIVGPEEVGEATAEAVTNGHFLVLTVPEVRDELVERALDIETYLQRRIAEQSA